MLTIDRREIQEHPTIEQLITIPHTIDTLDSADYAFLDCDNEPVGIERAEISDLISKLRSGRLEEQMTRCDQNYHTIILLVEGVYDFVGGFLATYKQSERGYYRTKIYPHTRYDHITAMLIRLAQMGIEIVHSPNFEASMIVVQTIYHQRTKPEAEHSLFKRIRPINIPVKLSANPAVPRLMALIPRIPEKTAIRLINKYGGIWTILNTDDKELLTVEGMGKGLVDKLKKGVGKDA